MLNPPVVICDKIDVVDIDKNDVVSVCTSPSSSKFQRFQVPSLHVVDMYAAASGYVVDLTLTAPTTQTQH